MDCRQPLPNLVTSELAVMRELLRIRTHVEVSLVFLSNRRLRIAPRVCSKLAVKQEQLGWFVSRLDQPSHPIGNYDGLSSSFHSEQIFGVRGH